MHNHALEKAEELENDYKESLRRYKNELKSKNEHIERLKAEIDSL